MLDFNTIQVINSNMENPASRTLIIFIVIAAIFIAISTMAFFGRSAAMLGLGFASLFLFGSFYCAYSFGAFDNLALIRIETENIQMVPDVYPSEEYVSCLKKEGDKIYYYRKINPKLLEKPNRLKEMAEEHFKELLIDLKDSELQEVN